MPSNKKPRHKRAPKTMKDINGKRPIMQVYSKTHGVTLQNRVLAQNAVLAILAAFKSGLATKQDVDMAGYAGALWESLARYGYGVLDVPMALSFEQSRRAALRRGEQLGKFGLNPSELDVISVVLFGLIDAIKITPEPVFKKIDDEVRLILGVKQ
jgi:hypothetical protein